MSYLDIQFAQQFHDTVVEEIERENLIKELRETDKPNRLGLWLGEQLIHIGQTLKIRASRQHLSDNLRPLTHGMGG
ncbi:MAG TPA: hypothetical protein PKW33_04140 [Anaerolineaceae bacterium]|nr:hypothetical protein [Anaerolineaceae bacterium]HPN50752.1 hypothetical protein [Anaerolineaceae bacterium]